MGRADIVELWQQRRWRTLLNLIDHLPAASHLGEAMANDDEAARAWLASKRVARNRAPKFSEYDAVVAELTVHSDLLAQVLRTLIATGGAKAPDIRARPRPETAVDRLRAQLRRATHDDLVRRLLPNRQLDSD